MCTEHGGPAVPSQNSPVRENGQTCNIRLQPPFQNPILVGVVVRVTTIIRVTPQPHPALEYTVSSAVLSIAPL